MTVFDLDLIAEIRVTADLLNEIEQQRKRVGNRRGAMTRTTPDSDGEVRGLGFREDSFPVVLLDDYLAALAVQEAIMVGALEKAMKRHPLAGWIKAQRGLGFKQLGRLLAILEDPSWHPVEERPRTLPELNAYCGLVPNQRRARGQQGNWSTEAQMRVHLIAESAVKQVDRGCKIDDEIVHATDCRCSPYRLVYEHRRAYKADAVHTAVCPQCGPSGHPALVGSPWPPAHQHGDALRYVGKRILRDLWREARRVNGYEVMTLAS